MRNLLLSLITLVGTAVSAQAPKVVDKHIRTLYGENYSLISVDTVAMPIRIVRSVNFATTLDFADITDKIKRKSLYTGKELLDYTKRVIEDFLEKTSDYISCEDIVYMRNMNKPHADDYYNYQRTVVFLHESNYREVFYVRLGENSISMTETEYDIEEGKALENLKALEKARTDLENVLKNINGYDLSEPARTRARGKKPKE